MKKVLVLVAVMSLVVACGKKKGSSAGSGSVPCEKGSEKKSKEGKLVGCTLAKDFTASDVPCKKGSKIGFHKNGIFQRCAMSKAAKVQGFPCKGSISFDEKGKVYYCEYTSEEFKAGGASIPEGTTINPFGDGVVRHASTNKGRKIVFGAYKCSTLKIKKDGKVEKCQTIGKSKIQDKDVPEKSWLCFDGSGKVTNGSGCFKF